MRLRRPALLLPRAAAATLTAQHKRSHEQHATNVTADASGGDSVSISRDLLDVLAKVLDGRADPAPADRPVSTGVR